MRRFPAALLAVLAAGAVNVLAVRSDPAAAGAPGEGDGSGAHAAEARIYAAASLRDVIAALAEQFEPMRDGRVVAAFGASNTLAQQLREGAAPGVFISASSEWVDKLGSWDMVELGSRVDLLGNALVVIVPKGAKDRPASLSDLVAAKYARLALADPEAAPAGKYARAALEKSGVFARVRSKIVAAPDVRTALTYVERGEIPAGIVYATDAAASDRVEVAFRVPSDLHPKIVYPMVLVKGANRQARELHAFLQSPQAWAVFAKAGFTKP